MAENTVPVSEAVMERVNAEIYRSLVETPHYIRSIVDTLLKEPQSRGYAYNDPDNGKPLFEVLLRRQLRMMIEQSTVNCLKEKYQDRIDEVVKASVDSQEKLDGSLANAFARILADEYRVTVNTEFKIEHNK